MLPPPTTTATWVPTFWIERSSSARRSRTPLSMDSPVASLRRASPLIFSTIRRYFGFWEAVAGIQGK